MSDRPDDKAAGKPAGRPAAAGKDRLAAALRANLLRRKAQARAKAATGDGPEKDE